MRSTGKRIFLGIKNTLHGSATTGSLMLIAMIVIVITMGFLLVGGQLPGNRAGVTGSQVVIITPVPEKAKSDLQLYTFLGVTVTPTPIPSPTTIPNSGSTQKAQCNDSSINEEPENFEAGDPISPNVAAAGGQIKVWVTDENTPFIAPNEFVDNTTGKIITPGNRTAQDGKGHIIEPRLYIAPDDVVTNRNPFYPSYVKGNYGAFTGGSTGPGPAMDPLPANNTGSAGVDDEYVWDVNSLGLTPGTYEAQVIIHDGDDDQGAGCFTIIIK